VNKSDTGFNHLGKYAKNFWHCLARRMNGYYDISANILNHCVSGVPDKSEQKFL
jgi:hypothetical protein